MAEQQISAIHTPCKTCVFAEYTDNTQTGCAFGMIEKYQKGNKVEVLEAYDDEKEFYIINNKKCAAFKEQKYFDSRNLSDAPMILKIAYVRSKMSLNYAAVINLDDVDKATLIDILIQLRHASIPPKDLILIRKAENEKRFALADLQDSFNASTITARWRLETIVNPDEPFVYTLHRITNVNRTNNFIMVIGKDYAGINELTVLANKLIYEEFETFQVLCNKSEETIFYSTSVYKSAIAHGVDILEDKEKFQSI